jgi:hypothetical protein
MVNVHTFILSDDLFSGFTCQIDLDYMENIKDIIDNMLEQLNGLLMQYNMHVLKEKLNDKNLHIHDHSFEEILISKANTIFYICSHC